MGFDGVWFLGHGGFMRMQNHLCSIRPGYVRLFEHRVNDKTDPVCLLKPIKLHHHWTPLITMKPHSTLLNPIKTGVFTPFMPHNATIKPHETPIQPPWNAGTSTHLCPGRTPWRLQSGSRCSPGWAIRQKMAGWWLSPTPLKNRTSSQLGWWNSQLHGKS